MQPSIASTGGQWVCTACTFRNTKTQGLVCEVCQAPRQKEPPRQKKPLAVVQRHAYNEEIRKHLLRHATPHTLETDAKMASIFRMRAHLAHTVVEKRRSETSCTSQVAFQIRRSPSAQCKDSELILQQLSREEKIMEGLQLLQQRVDFIKVRIKKMGDDGNCQFRALSNELYGSQEHHQAVRDRVITHLREHADEFSFFVSESKQEWEDYLQRMSRSRTWGDELTLRAASDAYQCVVHIVTTTHENWLLHYGAEHREKHEAEGTHVPECFLAYVSPIHYNVIAMPDS